MNLFYNALKKAGVLRMDQVKREDGKWYPIDDAKKLMRRLTSNSHSEFKTAHPKGFNTMKKYIQTNPQFHKYIGDYLQRAFFPRKKRVQHRQAKKGAPTFVDLTTDDEYEPKRKR